MSSAMTPFARAVAGAVIMLFLASGSYAGARIALGALDERGSIRVVLGELGQGIVSGTDVKIRGVRVGAVRSVDLDDDLRAVVTVDLDGGVRVPERSTFLVTGKTLLGEKQIEVLFDGPIEEGPFLAEGETVSDPAAVVEVEDVLAALADLTQHIDPDDLAVVFSDFFGAFEGMGPDIARSIDEGERASAVFARTLDDQERSTRALSLVAEALGPTGEDFNRLGRNVAEGMPAIGDNHAGLARLLGAVEGFARELDVTLRVNRADIDRMMIGGDNVLRLLFHYRLELGQVIEGVVDYTTAFDEGFRNPGVEGQAAYFQIILEGEDFESQICAGMPEQLREQIEECEPHTGAPSSVPVALPRDLVRPEVPERLPLDALLRRALPGATSIEGGA